jgi:hypothetical protein
VNFLGSGSGNHHHHGPGQGIYEHRRAAAAGISSKHLRRLWRTQLTRIHEHQQLPQYGGLLCDTDTNTLLVYHSSPCPSPGPGPTVSCGLSGLGLVVKKKRSVVRPRPGSGRKLSCLTEKR